MCMCKDIQVICTCTATCYQVGNSHFDSFERKSRFLRHAILLSFAKFYETHFSLFCSFMHLFSNVQSEQRFSTPQAATLALLCHLPATSCTQQYSKDLLAFSILLLFRRHSRIKRRPCFCSSIYRSVATLDDERRLLQPRENACNALNTNRHFTQALTAAADSCGAADCVVAACRCWDIPCLLPLSGMLSDMSH